MFTPPPSPNPPRRKELPDSETTPLSKESMEESLRHSSLYPQDVKRRIGRRFRWAVLSVPLIVIFLTFCFGYTTGRVTPESSSPLPPLSWHGLLSEGSPLRHHKRNPEPEPQLQATTLSLQTAASPTSGSSAPVPSSSGTPVSQQAVPNIPSAPPTLPTPFPQPFDGSIAQNFSSVSCANFFANMTNTTPFRSCRPFSLLLGSSTQFINAQTNLTLMNSIIWGTCNTNTDYNQCQANMNWFASTLKTSCVEELKDLNTMVVSTLMALNAFQVMHDVACEADPSSNTYCYLNAVRNSNPSDSYYYQLPLGIPLPKSSVPTCSACAKSVMGIYATALQDATTGPLLTGLQSTYESSARLSVQFCGSGFANTALVNAALSTVRRPSALLAGFLGAFVWIISAQLS
ncbi:hypothetical protein GALMADRAFT_62417 [Galerina marginata CBS 339.88]|uniref:DUF7729 domain-containing protein n=1 Tax=Galerina marginata (strain CBS 339.88) TaxID=685588 RepID=A0A067TK40_GALM3|nr:hypothetical protein GALMADRAFT_62417 [Galerina marginata CBS 339.88]